MYAAGLKGSSSGIVRNPTARPSSSHRLPTTGEENAVQQRGGTERKCIGALPPNVDARPRGTLTVGFGNFRESPRLTPGNSATTVGVRWNSAKVYVAVDLQLVWWGQKASTPLGTLRWTQGRKEADSVHYEVRTSAELFQRYLKSCEPLRLRLYSKRTETLIGTAKVPIPGKIINFIENEPGQAITGQSTGEIQSVRGFRLGELCLEFSLKLDQKELAGKNAPKPIAKQAQSGKENRKMMCIEKPVQSAFPAVVPQRTGPLVVEGRVAPLHETKQRPLTGGSSYLTAAKKKFHTLDHESKRKVLDYLTGKPFDEDHSRPSSERSTLSEICSISPAESMLEALARFDAAPDRGKQPYLQAVDCVRVLVEGLRLTRAGQKEMQHRTKNQWITPDFSGIIVKMKFSRNPTTTLLKFISNPMAFDEMEVSFEGQPKTTRLVLPAGGEDEGATFEFSVHLNVASTIAKARLFHLGTAAVTLRELLDGRLGCHKRCPVRLAADDILLGTLTIRMQLGRRGLHFGSELIDAVMIGEGNVTLESESSDSDSWDEPVTEPLPTEKRYHAHRPRSCGHQLLASRHHLRHHGLFPSASWTCTRHTGCPSDNQSTSAKQSGNQQSKPDGKDHSEEPARNDRNGAPDRQQSTPNAMETETSNPATERVKLLHGLLHLGQLRSLPASDYFLVSHAFWTEDSTTLTSDLSPEGGNFNFLHTFAVLANGAFIERVRNQHMVVEIWEKPRGEPEKLLGLTRLPLHQFYIAFRDAQLSEHLSHAKLPVISIDGWSGIGSPLAGEPCGDIQAILAIGTEAQIEHFKSMRILHHVSPDVPRTLANRGPAVPVSVSSPTRRIYPRPEHKSIQTMSSGAKQPQTSEVANMLSAFIENLAQRLPISSERSTAPSYDHSNASVDQPMNGPHVGSPHSNANRPQLRKTADLLDNLQKALSQRPPASALDGLGGLGGLGMASLLGASSTPADQTPPAAGAGTASGQPHDATVHPVPKEEGVVATTSSSEGTTEPQPTAESSTSVAAPSGENIPAPVDECKVFRVAIEIEQAVNLPKLTISKKYAKRHKNRNVPDTLELEPSAYATFEGYNLKPGMPNTVKSHEGIVYTTHVLERNCSPGWQKRFEVQLPVDLMMNDEKRFILKVWRKAALSDAPKCRLLPAPMEDAVIGFCAIDLSVLLSGMPYILGWYNIMDFSGRCNGQIKVNVQPLENVQVYKTLDEQMNFQIPLSIDVDCGAIGLDAASNTSLSRALKRKFTELEEITERLKARLFDVTGDDDAADPDDQFERDLNTEADEEEEDESWPDQFGDMSNQKRNSQYPNGALTLTTNTSSYSMCSTDQRVCEQPERSLTGCSNRNQVRQAELQLEDLIQAHDIDTLINPAIIKNLLNPSNSEETPTLVDDAGGEAATDADMSDGDTSSRSSLLPKDKQAGGGGAPGDVKVRQIASALQRTTISDTTVTTGKCREAPEGEPMKDVNN